MPTDALLENRLQLDKEFLDLINTAAQEKGDGEKLIQTERDYVSIEITPSYKAVIGHFINLYILRYDQKYEAILDLIKPADRIFFSGPGSLPFSYARRIPPSTKQITQSSTPITGISYNTTYGDWKSPGPG